MNRITLLAVIGSAALVLPGSGRSFSIPDKVAAPGAEVEFPVSLDNAAGCASIQLQVNFDPQILEFKGFDGGDGLGSQFEPTAYHENGVAVVIWTRASNLVSGSGSLGRIKFRVNPGASAGLKSSLAIADCDLSDASGTVKLAVSGGVSGNHSGSLVVGAAPADGDGDGMPDEWETLHTLDPQVAGADADSDQDGRSDFMEYALGGNPRVKDPERTPATVGVQEAGAEYLAMAFDRRPNAGLVYRVWEGQQLTTWTELDIAARMAGPAVDHGDGTERVVIRSSYRMRGPDFARKGFMKLEVTRP